MKIPLMMWKLRRNRTTLLTKPLSQELIEDYISGDDGVPVSMQYDNDWEDRFFAELGSSQADSDSLIQEDPHEEEGQFT